MIRDKMGTKDGRINAKCVHITLQGLKNDSKTYWLEKAKTFRSNVVATLVGMEENHAEGKGLHAHIVIQFSTKQKLSRKQFVEHFGTDSLHIATKPSKNALLMALGYVSKTGNTAQHGKFTSRGVELDADPEIYRFKYQVTDKMSAARYFSKVIKENLKKNKNIIEDYAKRDDEIGYYLSTHPVLMRAMHKNAQIWHIEDRNRGKNGFKFKEWVEDDGELKKHYKNYLRRYPKIFEKHLSGKVLMELEKDFRRYAEDDLRALRNIIIVLQTALKYGSKRPLKSPNLFLWSKAPSFGKTRLLNFLDANLVTYRLPDDQYYLDYKNDVYNLLVSDEAATFLQSKTYSHLKHILEGQHVEFNMKGKTKVIKEDNPLVVLADNVSFSDLMNGYFKKRYQPDVMATRIVDIELKSRATLHFFLDNCFKNTQTSSPS